MKVSLDVDDIQSGIEDVVELTDYLIPSEAEKFYRARGLSGLTELARQSRGFVAMTRGREGTAAIWNGRAPGLPRPSRRYQRGRRRVSRAFIYSLFQNWSVERCLLFAGAAASLSCTRVGARAGRSPLPVERSSPAELKWK